MYECVCVCLCVSVCRQSARLCSMQYCSPNIVHYQGGQTDKVREPGQEHIRERQHQLPSREQLLSLVLEDYSVLEFASPIFIFQKFPS